MGLVPSRTELSGHAHDPRCIDLLSIDRIDTHADIVSESELRVRGVEGGVVRHGDSRLQAGNWFQRVCLTSAACVWV